MLNTATLMSTAAQQSRRATRAIAKSRGCRRTEKRRVCRAASTWSPTNMTTPAILPMVLLLVLLLSLTEAEGLWGRGGGRGGQQHRGFIGQSTASNDDDMDEIFEKLQKDQFWADVDNAGMELLEEEVAEKEKKKVFVQVAKACSIGAQMTLVMGVGALFFRLLPILQGDELEDEEEIDAACPYLLQSDDASGRVQQALPAAGAWAGEGGRQQLLTSGRADEHEDSAIGWGGVEGGRGRGVDSAADDSVEVVEDESGGVAVANEAQKQGTVAITTGGGEVGEEEEIEVGEGDVVVDTRTRSILRKVKRVSRPFVRVIAPPLAVLLVARFTLGNLLAERVDPTIELLFGDDIIDLYSVNKKMVDEVDIPFPADADGVPGRTKMKGRKVQRLPRPEGEAEEEEEDDEEDGRGAQREAEYLY